MASMDLVLRLYQPRGGAPRNLGFKIYRGTAPVPLSDSLPMLEHMGVRVLAERTYQVAPDGAEPQWIHDFQLEAGSDEIAVETLAPLFEDAFARVFTGRIDNDDFNRLVLKAGLAADEVTVVRAYAKYLRQIGVNLSESYMQQTLANNALITRLLIDLFKNNFDPNLGPTAMRGATTPAAGVGRHGCCHAADTKIRRPAFPRGASRQHERSPARVFSA